MPKDQRKLEGRKRHRYSPFSETPTTSSPPQSEAPQLSDEENSNGHDQRFTSRSTQFEVFHDEVVNRLIKIKNEIELVSDAETLTATEGSDSDTSCDSYGSSASFDSAGNVCQYGRPLAPRTPETLRAICNNGPNVVVMQVPQLPIEPMEIVVDELLFHSEPNTDEEISEDDGISETSSFWHSDEDEEIQRACLEVSEEEEETDEALDVSIDDGRVHQPQVESPQHYLNLPPSPVYEQLVPPCPGYMQLVPPCPGYVQLVPSSPVYEQLVPPSPVYEQLVPPCPGYAELVPTYGVVEPLVPTYGPVEPAVGSNDEYGSCDCDYRLPADPVEPTYWRSGSQLPMRMLGSFAPEEQPPPVIEFMEFEEQEVPYHVTTTAEHQEFSFNVSNIEEQLEQPDDRSTTTGVHRLPVRPVPQSVIQAELPPPIPSPVYNSAISFYRPQSIQAEAEAHFGLNNSILLRCAPGVDNECLRCGYPQLESMPPMVCRVQLL